MDWCKFSVVFAGVVGLGCSLDANGLGSEGGDSIGGESGSTSADSETGASTTGGGSDSAGSTAPGSSGPDPTAGSSGDPSTSGSTQGSTSGGDGPLVEISDGPTYDFGIVEVGTDALHGFTITNTGNADATSFKPAELSGVFAFGTSTCGESLGAGESCEIEVQLSPAVFGGQSDTFTIQYGPVMASTSVDLAGAGGGTTNELVVNGGGENGGSPPQGWSEVSGEDWAAGDFGPQNPSHSGSNSIHPGVDDPSTHELIQDVDVTKFADVIDAGELRFDFSGWGRSWFSGEDEYRLVVEFHDADGQIGDDLIDTDWNLGTVWAEYTGFATAPAGARVVRVSLLCDLTNSVCDAFFDDISLTATYEP